MTFFSKGILRTIKWAARKHSGRLMMHKTANLAATGRFTGRNNNAAAMIMGA